MSIATELEELANPFDTDGDCSEEYRHQCEVREVAGWATDEERASFLAMVERQRGIEAAQRLRRDVWGKIKGADL